MGFQAQQRTRLPQIALISLLIWCEETLLVATFPVPLLGTNIASSTAAVPWTRTLASERQRSELTVQLVTDITPPCDSWSLESNLIPAREIPPHSPAYMVVESLFL